MSKKTTQLILNFTNARSCAFFIGQLMDGWGENLFDTTELASGVIDVKTFEEEQTMERLNEMSRTTREAMGLRRQVNDLERKYSREVMKRLEAELNRAEKLGNKSKASVTP
jgi:hypothetical protein